MSKSSVLRRRLTLPITCMNYVLFVFLGNISNCKVFKTEKMFIPYVVCWSPLVLFGMLICRSWEINRDQKCFHMCRPFSRDPRGTLLVFRAVSWNQVRWEVTGSRGQSTRHNIIIAAFWSFCPWVHFLPSRFKLLLCGDFLIGTSGVKEVIWMHKKHWTESLNIISHHSFVGSPLFFYQS